MRTGERGGTGGQGWGRALASATPPQQVCAGAQGKAGRGAGPVHQPGLWQHLCAGTQGEAGRGAGPVHQPGLPSRCGQGRGKAVPGAGRYLVQGAHAGLEDHVGVEQEGAQEGLRIAGQLCDDANEQQVHVQRVLQHVLQLG